MLHGYVLKETQCKICEMPLMEKDGKMDCVVCPVLAKKAKKKKKAEEESEIEKISKLKLAAATLTTQEANFAVMAHEKKLMESIESVKSDISKSSSVEASAKAQEEKYMAMLERAKTTGLQEAKQEKYMKQLAAAMVGPTFPVEEKSNELNTKPILPVETKNINPNDVVNFVKTTRQDISPEEEAELRFAEEEALHKVMLDERKVERERLLAENRRVAALRLQEKGRAEAEQIQKEAEDAAALAAKIEDLKKAKEEKITLAEKIRKEQEEQRANVKAVLNSLNNPQDSIVERVGIVAEESKQKAEKAADLAQIALDHLSSVQNKIFHDSVNQATKMAYVEMDEFLAKENGVSHKSQVTIEEIKHVEVVNPFPIAGELNKHLQKSDQPVSTTLKPLTITDTANLNSVSDSKSSFLSMGHTALNILKSTISKSREAEALVTEPSNTVIASTASNKKENLTTELLSKKEPLKTQATKTDIPENTALRATTDDTKEEEEIIKEPDEKSELEKDSKTQATKTDIPEYAALKATTDDTKEEEEIVKEPDQKSELEKDSNSSNAVKAPSPTENSRSQKSIRKMNEEDFAAKRAFVSKEIGQRMIQGWTLLDVACPFCVMPLMTEKSGGEHICVVCGNLEVKKKEEEQKEKERAKIIEEQKLKEETERLKKKHEQMMKEEEELRLKREEEEAKRKALAEKKRKDDEAIRSRVEAEVKKREEEIKNDLKETEERVRINSQNMSEEMQRSAERERLVAERKRFAEIVNEVNKIEEIRKKQEVEDAKSVDSRRSRFSQDSRRSRQSAVPKVSTVNDADDASVGGVSIQFPPDFDYDDEDAIRQVISLAKLKNKNASPTKPSEPPTSITIVSSPPETPTKKKAPLLPPHSGEKRKPLIPPGNKSSPVQYVSPLQRDHAKLSTDYEEFDDGVSNMSMGTYSQTIRKNNLEEKNGETEREKREARRASILERLKRAPSPSLHRERSATPTSARTAALSSRVAELRSRSLTRAPRNPESSSLQDGSSRRTYRERSESLKKLISKTTSPSTGNDDASAHSPKSIHSSSSRRSTLDDILSKIENAKAQLSKK